MSEPRIGPPHCRRCGDVVEDYILRDGLCGYCTEREHAAVEEEAAALDTGKPPPPPPPAEPPEALVEYAATLYGIRYPPGPLRTAAVVGAMLSRGLDATACSALAVEQMGAALEARGREAARLALRGEDPSAELLAARLDADRLRVALESARLSLVAAGAHNTAIELRSVLAAPPPDLGPLRELIAAASVFHWADPPTAAELQCLIDARRAMLNDYPSLAGEG